MTSARPVPSDVGTSLVLEVGIAPVVEEFVFRGLVFQIAAARWQLPYESPESAT